MVLKNDSCILVHELNDTYTYCRIEQKCATCFANERASLDVADNATVQVIASTKTILPGNLSGASDKADVAAEIRENGGFVIPVRISS